MSVDMPVPVDRIVVDDFMKNWLRIDTLCLLVVMFANYGFVEDIKPPTTEEVASKIASCLIPEARESLQRIASRGYIVEVDGRCFSC